MKSPDQLEIQELEKEYANLIAKYESLSEQIEGELNEDNKETLRHRKDVIKRKIDEAWSKMEALKRKSSDRKQQYRTFKEDLPKIDFDEVMDEMDCLIRSFRQERGDALLLVQESFSMAGELCLERVRNVLKSTTGDFSSYPLGFYLGDDLNEYGWLYNLARYFGLATGTTPEELAKSIIDTLCQLVRIGSTIFIEIHKWDDLPCQEETLAWFIKHFWIPLVSRLDDRKKYLRVKFIAAIVVDSELSPACFEETCLCEPEVTSFRWLQLPLRNWTQEEIQEWLECYPGIGNPRSINLSQRFFRASKQGIPTMVCQALEKELLLTTS